MATVAFASHPCRRLSLETIDSMVSARLGPTRIPGNEQPACFNRQVAMYLPSMSVVGAQLRSAGSITGATTQLSATASNELNLYGRTIPKSMP